MNKTYSISKKRWPNLPDHDILLEINDRDTGKIEIEELTWDGETHYSFRFMMFDDCWSYLPVIAADLYKHELTPGRGYATLESATQAAAAILEAHGWKEKK